MSELIGKMVQNIKTGKLFGPIVRVDNKKVYYTYDKNNKNFAYKNRKGKSWNPVNINKNVKNNINENTNDLWMDYDNIKNDKQINSILKEIKENPEFSVNKILSNKSNKLLQSINNFPNNISKIICTNTYEEPYEQYILNLFLIIKDSNNNNKYALLRYEENDLLRNNYTEFHLYVSSSLCEIISFMEFTVKSNFTQYLCNNLKKFIID